VLKSIARIEHTKNGEVKRNPSDIRKMIAADEEAERQREQRAKGATKGGQSKLLSN
jgi:hypothetical protein